MDIINTTHIAELIKLSYLSSREESTTDDDSRNSEDATSELSQWIDGSAIKLAMNRWQVIVSNGDSFIVDEEDLLDNKQYFVKQAFETEGKLQKQRQAQKAKRKRCMEQKGQHERELLRKAHTEMSSKIAGAVTGETA